VLKAAADKDGGEADGASQQGEWVVGPSCTDNFQIKEIQVKGERFHSVEQAYQAAKQADPKWRAVVAGLAPKRGESTVAFGNRCWSAGQRGPLVQNWEAIKVDVMYEINMAKYMQHEDLRAELLSTGDAVFKGGPSTAWTYDGVRHGWTLWNGMIQMRIREELRLADGADVGPTLTQLRTHFEQYRGRKPAEPAAAEATMSQGGLAERLQAMVAAGLEFPWACPECTLVNERFPQLCEVCDAPNPQYAKVVAGMPSPRAVAVETDPKVITIGDLHGNIREATALWRNLERRLGSEGLAAATVIFLGDYCDRGPDTKAIIDMLIELRDTRPAGSTHFIAGNHDFAFAAFLGCLPVSVPLDEGYLESTRNPAWTKGFYTPPVKGGMHYLGRRWGGSMLYDAQSTFASYGVKSFSGRDALIAAVPEAHKEFLRNLAWVHDQPLDFPPGRLVCAHAGLTSDAPVEEQIAALKARDPRAKVLLEANRPDRVAAFVGRELVEDLPPDADFCLVSGHHGFHHVSPCGRRVIIDEGGGVPGRPIQAHVLPDGAVVTSHDRR